MSEESFTPHTINLKTRRRSNQMETESMTPAAGSVSPSQRMGKKSGYSKGASPDDVFLSMEYDDALAEINKLPPDEKKAALVKLHQRQREQRKPYKH